MKRNKPHDRAISMNEETCSEPGACRDIGTHLVTVAYDSEKRPIQLGFCDKHFEARKIN